MTDFQWFRSPDIGDHKSVIDWLISLTSRVVDVFQLMLFISALQFLLERRLNKIDVFWFITLFVLLFMYFIAIALFHRVIFASYVFVLRAIYRAFSKDVPVRTGRFASIPSFLFLLVSGGFIPSTVDGFISFIQELAK